MHQHAGWANNHGWQAARSRANEHRVDADQRRDDRRGVGAFDSPYAFLYRPNLGPLLIIVGSVFLGLKIYLRLTAPKTPAQIAKQIADRAKALHQQPHEHVLVGPEAFDLLHREFFDRQQQLMEAEGFRHIADWQDRTVLKLYGLHSVVRTMFSRDGTIIGSISEQTPVGAPAKHPLSAKLRRTTVSFTSRYTDGTLVTTTTTEESVKPDLPPYVHIFRLEPGTNVQELLAQHRRHLDVIGSAVPGRKLIRTETIQELFQRLDALRESENKRRAPKGYINGDRFREALGERKTAFGEAVARELDKMRIPTPPPLPGTDRIVPPMK